MFLYAVRVYVQINKDIKINIKTTDGKNVEKTLRYEQK